MRFAFPGLLSCAERKAVVVTPTPLLASVATRGFARTQLENERRSWERPAVYSVNAWLANCWQEARFGEEDVPLLLSGAQEQVLWQQIIQREHPDLFDVSGTARLAAHALRILTEWQILPDGEAWKDNEDALHFQRWLESFRSICRQNNWITRVDVWRLLPGWMAHGLCKPPDTVFAGFETITPALRALVEAQPKSYAVIPLDRRQQQVIIPAKQCEDFEQEIDHAARWARAEFERNPSQSIAVFVPDLEQSRSLARRIFEQVFYPAATFRFLRRETPADRVQPAFHVGTGEPLSQHPLIASALLLLDLARPRFRLESAGSILRSPFIAGAALERSVRALADVRLREKREPDVALRDLERVTGNCPLLTRIWPSVRAVLRRRKGVAELSDWSEFIGTLLKAAGWPGSEELSDREQKALDAWENSLADLAALGLVSKPVTLDEATSHLCSLLAISMETGDWDSPVQVLDANEAAGLEFDAAMICGLSDERWPPGVDRASPLIPLKVQRAHGVPGSSPQMVWAERERMSSAVFAAAPVLRATYSGRVSPAVQRVVEPGAQTEGIWVGKRPWESFQPVALEELEDSLAPAYLVNGLAKGGTGIIKAQSLCPFRAFAEYRLSARSLEDASLGLDSRERGGFLHRALEFVWQELKTSQRLQSILAKDLECLVKQSVENAVSINEASPLHEAVSEVERWRLQALILDWLDVERQRKKPFTVELTEQERIFELAGLPLRLRVDRMDRLPDGSILLIDYKSGAQSKGKLDCPRPQEPQLLVYASAVGSEVDGVYLAELKPRDPKVVGVAREKHFKTGTITVRKDDWEDYLAEADAEVSRLAKQFAGGWAAVDPAKGACDFCGNKPFCRVNENAREEQETE
ncbi:MAG: PD-(D/E)XK nuclease family protein [Acidobacteriaceae bacterium]|nr:PD-(D/E)XK nuclease family protein [Acidobacteriaceae bacterium]